MQYVREDRVIGINIVSGVEMHSYVTHATLFVDLDKTKMGNVFTEEIASQILSMQRDMNMQLTAEDIIFPPETKTVLEITYARFTACDVQNPRFLEKCKVIDFDFCDAIPLPLNEKADVTVSDDVLPMTMPIFLQAMQLPETNYVRFSFGHIASLDLLRDILYSSKRTVNLVSYRKNEHAKPNIPLVSDSKVASFIENSGDKSVQFRIWSFMRA